MASAPKPGRGGLSPECVSQGRIERPDADVLFREHSAHVASVVARMLGRVADVDDVVQEVFVKALCNLDGLRNPESVRAWLSAIAHRVSCNWLAGQRARRRVESDCPAQDVEVATRGIAADEAALLAQVWGIVEGLPSGLRDPWVLRYARGEDIADIARQCRCSRATAKRRIIRAHGVVLKGLSARQAPAPSDTVRPPCTPRSSSSTSSAWHWVSGPGSRRSPSR